jgi:flavin reductase (DIM6/NTAB) family NADH-FMN oxidoreductase RutF
MLIDVAEADDGTVYQTLIGVVTPRPIAWVTSVDLTGRVNLAPFSFFNAFGGTPPVVVFSPNRKQDGSKKDTLRNIEATGDFVINVAVAGLAEQVNLSSKELPAGDSEVELTGLSVEPSRRVKPPRLRESPIHLECQLLQVLQIGKEPTCASLVIGEIVLMHVSDTVLDGRGRIDPSKVQALGRLGGNFYCRTGDIFEMKRP